MATAVQWHHFNGRNAFVMAVFQDVSSVISDAVEARGRATVAFPGGTTPLPILEALAAAPLPWLAVTVIPSDDRLVPLASALSNVAVLARFFSPRGARVIALGEDAVDYRRAGREADARLQQLAWPLDLVWLGMGSDGHTASIFAGPDLEQALAPAAGVRAVGVRPDPLPAEAPVHRVTLTAPAIAAARRTVVVISGEEKRRVLEQAIADGASSRLPIGRVLATARAPVLVYCLL